MKLADDVFEQRLTLDVTPLIDIVFLLVMFFALSTSFISRTDLAALRDSVVVLTADKRVLSLENEALAASVTEKTRVVSRLETELAAAAERTSELNAMMRALENERLALEVSLATSDESRKSIQAQLERAFEDFKRLDLELVGLASDNARQAETEQALRALLAERETEAGSLADRLRMTASDLADEASEREQVEATLAARAQELARTRGERDRHADQERMLEALLAERVAELEGLRIELVAATEKVVATDADLAAAREAQAETARAMESARAEALDREARAASIQAALDRAAMRLATLEGQARAQSTRAESDAAALAAARAELATARRESTTLRTENLALRTRLGRLENLARLDEEQIERILAAEERLQEGLAADLESDRIGIDRGAQSITLKLSDRILFDSGSAEIKPEGLAVLGRVGAIIRDRISGLDVRIGGHTDNVPVTNRTGVLGSNWGLSAARAVNVVRYLERELAIAPGALSAVGYGEHQPVASNDTAAGRARNRRIEIVLVPR